MISLYTYKNMHTIFIKMSSKGLNWDEIKILDLINYMFQYLGFATDWIIGYLKLIKV